LSERSGLVRRTYGGNPYLSGILETGKTTLEVEAEVKDKYTQIIDELGPKLNAFIKSTK